ncbi:MAG: hypothetical protein FMNOHCHN_01655 [Ignavibacteriaceae bacterium]|nr:hypothetical protein [Ignavibacteriaceae bacterium]
MKYLLSKYRFELLLFALMMVIFNRLFFSSSSFFSTYIWPLNMLLLGLASAVLLSEKKFIFTPAFFLLLPVLAVPLTPQMIFRSRELSIAALLVYIVFYSFLFYDVLRQITRITEVTESIIYGSLSGYLLLVIIASFMFLLQNHLAPGSFTGIEGSIIPEIYYQISYFSMITLTSIGFGDILPLTDNARLLTAFWGVAGQFSMVGIVGIIISKFSAK